MKKTEFFDRVKDYFQNSITEIKTDKSYQKKFIIVSCIEFLLLAFTIVLDLCMKEYLYDFWKANGDYTVIKGFLDITYTENTGAAFGMLGDSTMALTIVTTIVIVCILGYLLITSRKEIWLRISLVFIAGGGIGNLVDRIGLKYVRDFFEFTFTTKWGIFNIADCFVSVGAVMLVGYLVYVIIKDAVVLKKQKDAENNENSNLNVSNEENIEVVEDEKHDENAENSTSLPEETLEENSTEE